MHSRRTRVELTPGIVRSAINALADKIFIEQRKAKLNPCVELLGLRFYSGGRLRPGEYALGHVEEQLCWPTNAVEIVMQYVVEKGVLDVAEFTVLENNSHYGLLCDSELIDRRNIELQYQDELCAFGLYLNGGDI